MHRRMFCIALFSLFMTIQLCFAVADTCEESLKSASVLSPSPGTWSNYQSLVLDVSQDCLVFYSFTGDDPLFSGFAYDGPVLIEKDGEILLRIVTVTKENTTIEQKIEYTVDLKPSKEEFYTRALRTATIKISSQKPLTLPSTIKYCIGDNVHTYLDGRTLSLEVPNGLSRYVPLVISASSSFYRVMLYIESEKEAILAGDEKNDQFPFDLYCSNWTDFIITNADSVLFSLDGGSWIFGNGSVTIDRSVDHTVSWKYENENDEEARSFVLPKKPHLLISQVRGSSPLKVYLSNTNFTFKPKTDDVSLAAKSYSADGIYGEHFSTNLIVDIFYKGIRQGELSTMLSIDKQPPEKPVFLSTSQSFYARKPITIRIKSDDSIYYSITGPVLSNSVFADLEIGSIGTKPNKDKEYKLYKNSSFFLPDNKGGGLYYEVTAYAQDVAGNKSDYETYSVVVDSYNYYVCSSSSSDYVPDGSLARPFTSMKDVSSVLNKKDYVRLHISGSFTNVPPLFFNSDCDIIGSNGAYIQFADSQGLSIQDAHVTISNCVIEYQSELKNLNTVNSVIQQKMFFVKNSLLTLNNCEIVYSGTQNGSLIQTDNSTIKINDSGLTIQSLSYASAVTAVSSIIISNSSNFSIIAPNAVSFSVSRGSFFLDSSSVSITCDLGRIAQISSSMYIITQNVFTRSRLSVPSLKNTALQTSVQPVWADYLSIPKEYKNNTLIGF